MYYSKRPRTLSEQARLLSRRGMIGDRELIAARLEAVGYYRLSGYWYPFRQLDGDGNPINAFKPGTTLDEVWYRYVFDRQLRLIVLDAIERVEIAIRNHLVYHHAHAHGMFAYANDPSSLPHCNAKFYAAFQESVTKETGKSRENFITHYREKYYAHSYLPIWMVAETMTFGTMMTMYQFCSKQLKNDVANCLEISAKVLQSWLLALNAVRNICAHHSRLWNRELGVKPVIPIRKHHPEWHEPVAVPVGRVFGILTFCRYAISRIATSSDWPNRCEAFIAQYSNIPLDQMGFPDNWRDCPIWKVPVSVAPAVGNVTATGNGKAELRPAGEMPE